MSAARDPKTGKQMPAQLTYEGKAFVVGFPEKGKVVIYRPDLKKENTWAIKEEFGPVGKSFGRSVAISRDGNTILVSNQDNDVFAISVLTGKVISFATPPCRSFGKHVSISGDAKIAAIGATDLSGQGTVRLYSLSDPKAEKNGGAYIGEITNLGIEHSSLFAETFSLDEEGHILAVSACDKIDSMVLFYQLWYESWGVWTPLAIPKAKLIAGKDLSIDGKVIGLRYNHSDKVLYVVTRNDSDDRYPVFKGASVVQQEDGSFIDQKLLDIRNGIRTLTLKTYLDSGTSKQSLSRLRKEMSPNVSNYNQLYDIPEKRPA